MLTGITTRAEVDALPPDEQPDAVAADAEELAAALEAPRGARRPSAGPASSGTFAAHSVELGAERVERRLVDERDVERVAVDRPQVGQA